jgi:hypothetical protein
MIVSHLKSVGKTQVRMQREGSRIKKMSFAGVQIMEAKRLLSPGFSLATLAKTCGLKDQKGLFPFSQLTDMSFLKRDTLPADRSSWASELNPNGGPTQAEVDEALELYREMAFTSVSQYLIFYLKKDVTLLQQAMLKLCRGLYQSLGLHPVDSRKFTISSLSTTGAQSFLMRSKKIGMHFCNDSVAYAVRCILFILAPGDWQRSFPFHAVSQKRSQRRPLHDE